MQDFIESLSQEQLVNIIILLEDDKKKEAVGYITGNTPLDEVQALQVIEEIVREHDIVMKHESTGPRFSDDADDIDLVTPPLEIPNHPSLSAPTEAEITAQQLRENVPPRKIEKKIWIIATVAVILLILIWLIS
ncbi:MULTISPECIES: hypothetical protein [Acinetobacter]|uniref:Uncharacterized protein n=1 Tax=Acinetobacter pecorum TaxID=2762215 RepID=A0ABR8VZY1_9GAMM|nr:MULTISPECIES: hypothetical protein [Acinetobacter]MBD8010303.1 hypothetical protein [Acinetobacter pecorum]OAL78311.1 hypothetical protein AY607_07515 [Acinetobacter sp. SFA]OAL82209.1 hypothetical protein AY605_12975 [Acinetobacter sp. SFD]